MNGRTERHRTDRAMWSEPDPCVIDQQGDVRSHRQTAAMGQVRLHDGTRFHADQMLEFLESVKPFAGSDGEWQRRFHLGTADKIVWRYGLLVPCGTTRL